MFFVKNNIKVSIGSFGTGWLACALFIAACWKAGSLSLVPSAVLLPAVLGIGLYIGSGNGIN